MVEYFDNNNDDTSNSSIFHAKIRKEDLASGEKIDEIRRAGDELIRNAILQKQSYGQINKQIDSKFDGLLDRIESSVEESNADDSEGVLQKISELIKNFFDVLGVCGEEPNLKILLKKEKDKNWLASIIKALCNKLRKLLSKVFKKDLNWGEALEKETKELQKQLDSGDLSQDEMVKVLERLELLQTMKLKFQMAFASFLLTNFFTFLGGELAAAMAQEISTEENKKTESQEPEVKQAKEGAEGEVQVTEANKKDVESLSTLLRAARDRDLKVNAEKKPIIPLKPDLDSLKLSKNMKSEKLIEPKQQAQEKPKPSAPAPAAPVQQAPVKAPWVRQEHSNTKSLHRSNKTTRDEDVHKLDKTGVSTIKSINEQKIDNLYAQLTKKISIARERPCMNKQNVSQAESASNEVRSELNEVKKVEHLNEAVDVKYRGGI